MAEKLIDVLMRRDNLTRSEAQEWIDEMKDMVANGEDPENILHDECGLEPDYIWDILPD
jgi:hypothetical protein